MHKPLSELFDLKNLGDDVFEGRHQALGGGRVFGGQLVAQALAAAGRTTEGLRGHSLHAYFLRTGDLSHPIDYAVERLRDGRSFASRRVVASQQGRPIFHLSASFHAPEPGLEFQDAGPKVAGPETLEELGGATQRSSAEMRVEIRPVPSTQSRTKYWWLRLIDPLPEDPLLHRCALAYASDFGFLGTAREVHGIGFREKGVLVASLDHSLWFHREFRCDQWLLHAMECSSTSQGRGFVRGRIYTRDGALVASTAQEGIIRTDV